jgi:hypothetical protein
VGPDAAWAVLGDTQGDDAAHPSADGFDDLDDEC